MQGKLIKLIAMATLFNLFGCALDTMILTQFGIL